ncbi:hypothetical protein CPB84DRAFT_1540 [Gymnopilus junonius]|uniref:BOD1/SHG1 domain-containing protein n=1 Tax=Gymnopilus junonius TaxID=109634 RepID=A0A9P5P193_GYMJU|nr:hypothetical protein CPB84DRAFT_1540 [Gymnopilus junonius]
MPINNPTALVEEFKKSGEFDRLRRELLTQFQQDPSFVAFRESVEDIARKRIANDHERLQYLSSDVVLKELTQEVQRYPIVERAASNILQYEKGSTSSISKDGLEIGTKRTEVTQSSVHQPEKAIQEAHGSNILSEHPPPVGESHEQSLLPTADNPGSSRLKNMLRSQMFEQAINVF